MVLSGNYTPAIKPDIMTLVVSPQVEVHCTKINRKPAGWSLKHSASSKYNKAERQQFEQLSKCYSTLELSPG